MPEPGTLFKVELYSINLFKSKNQLINELVGMRKQWTMVFKPRTVIDKDKVFLFLEQEYANVPDPDDTIGFTFTLWKVLFDEEIGWIEYRDTNLVQK